MPQPANAPSSLSLLPEPPAPGATKTGDISST